MLFLCQSTSHGDILLGEQHADLFQYLPQSILEQPPEGSWEHRVIQPLQRLAPVFLPPLRQCQHPNHLCQREPSGPGSTQDAGSDSRQRLPATDRAQEQWLSGQEASASTHTLLHHQPSDAGANRCSACYGASPESGRVSGIGPRGVCSKKHTWHASLPGGGWGGHVLGNIHFPYDLLVKAQKEGCAVSWPPKRVTWTGILCHEKVFPHHRCLGFCSHSCISKMCQAKEKGLRAEYHFKPKLQSRWAPSLIHA